MDAVNELIGVLDREAVVIQDVLYRLKAVELLLGADEHRFLSEASGELDEALERLGALEAMRAMTAEGLAEAAGADAGELTLSQVLRLADDRQRGELVRVQLRLRRLLEEMDEQAQLGRDLVLARIAQVRAVLERVSRAPAARYGQDGLIRGPRPTGEFDERL